MQAIDTPISRSWTKMTFFGDLSIDGAGHELELDVGEGWYRNEHPTLEIQQGHFAGTNDAWRLNDILDGFMFRWGMPLSDTAEDHAMFISWLCDQIEDPCIEVYWGNFSGIARLVQLQNMYSFYKILPNIRMASSLAIGQSTTRTGRWILC